MAHDVVAWGSACAPPCVVWLEAEWAWAGGGCCAGMEGSVSFVRGSFVQRSGVSTSVVVVEWRKLVFAVELVTRFVAFKAVSN